MIPRLLILILLFLPQTASGECARQDYDSKQAPDFDCPGPEEEVLTPDLQAPPSIPVHQDEEVVPQWDGALVHRDRLVLIGLKLRAVRQIRWVERLRLSELHQIELAYVREQNAIREELLERQAVAARERALAAESRTDRAQAWYRSVWFGLILGFTAAAALVVAAAYIVTAI